MYTVRGQKPSSQTRDRRRIARQSQHEGPKVFFCTHELPDLCLHKLASSF